MPQSTLSLARTLELLPRALPQAKLSDLLFASKAEIVRQEGDAVTISVTPDRLDLLSEGGLGSYLGGATGWTRGLPRTVATRTGSAPEVTIYADRSVLPLRPSIAGFVATAPTDRGIDEGTLEEAIRFQEVLHATVGRDRAAASLGIYPLDRLRPPFRYSLEPMASVSWAPLGGSEEMSALRFFESHPLASRFGSLGRVGDLCLTLRDSRGSILSLPPVLNSQEFGRARVGHRRLLIESTGRKARAVREVLQLTLAVFAPRRFAISPVRVLGPRTAADAGRRLIADREIFLPRSTLTEIAGRPLTDAGVRRWAGQARLSSEPSLRGWKIRASPWRTDLGSAVDIVEDLLIARGLRSEEGVRPEGSLSGGRRPETRFRQTIASLLLGLGLQPMHHPVLTSLESLRRLGLDAVELANPPSTEVAGLRPNLLVSLSEALGHNTVHAYPQRLSEVGPTARVESRAEAGAETRYRAGFVIARDGTGFSEAASLVDHLLRSLDVAGVREPWRTPMSIPGRAARVTIAGESVAELGELHPRISSGWKIPVPVAWGELDLKALWSLLARQRQRAGAEGTGPEGRLARPGAKSSQ